MSFLNSIIGFKNKSLDYANKAFQDIDTTTNTAWSYANGLLFLGRAYVNLLNFEKSFEMYMNAFEYGQERHYPQVKANSLNGLAAISRIQNDLDQAISYHNDAIGILKKIGAKCDLAEAYFQLGLTYQAMRENDQAEEYKAKSLELFAQMEAPKQIERVNNVFEQGVIK